MLQRGLPAALQWAPAALSSAGCHLQQQLTAAQIGSSCCSSTAATSSIAFSNSNSSSSSVEGLAFCLQQRRCFQGGVVDVRGQPRRKKLPYFNPDDGPEAYHYWKDLWANPQKSPKPRRPRTLPVYLEPEEQQALMEAAIAAGVPRHLAEGDRLRQVPRLIAAVQRSGGKIPTDPDSLAARVTQLLALQRSVPGLDVLRIFKANGFGILSERPQDVEQQLMYLGNKLKQAGVAAEPGLLMSAAVKPALHYPLGLVLRAQQLPELLASELGRQPAAAAGEEDAAAAAVQEAGAAEPQAAAAAAAAGRLLHHPFKAALLNKSSSALQRHMRVLAQRHGQKQAASMYRKLPQLLLYRTYNLRRKTAVIADLLGLNPEQADQLVRADPRLMTYAPETLQQRAEALLELLGLRDQGALRRVVMRYPSLLRKSTESIEGKLLVVQEQLGLESSQEAAAVLRRHLCLAAHSATALQQPLQQLQQAADGLLPTTSADASSPRAAFSNAQSPSPLADLKSKAVEVLRAEPRLLTLGSNAAAGPQWSLAGRLQLLLQLAGISDSWRAAVAALAGQPAGDVAAVIGHREFVARLQWLLQQRPEEPPAQAAEHGGEAFGVYSLVMMRQARFELRFPGFVAQLAEQQAAAQHAVAQQADAEQQLQ